MVLGECELEAVAPRWTQEDLREDAENETRVVESLDFVPRQRRSRGRRRLSRAHLKDALVTEDEADVVHHVTQCCKMALRHGSEQTLQGAVAILLGCRGEAGMKGSEVTVLRAQGPLAMNIESAIGNLEAVDSDEARLIGYFKTSLHYGKSKTT